MYEDKKEFPLAGFPNSGNYLDIGQTQSTSKLAITVSKVWCLGQYIKLLISMTVT